MKFFIPDTESPEKAEEIYEAIRKFAVQTLVGWPIGSVRIRSITFSDKGKVVEAIVGEREPFEGEPVFAILESHQTYLVCTPNRGVLRGMPYMIGKHEVSHVEEFDPPQPADAPK